jgi:hypothetical protein
MSNTPLRDELKKILGMVGYLTDNNTSKSIKDTDVIQQVRSIPLTDVRGSLSELDSLGLIKLDTSSSASNTTFTHLNTTKEGIEALQNQELG